MRSTNTLTRADICEAVHKKTGYPKSESQQLVEDVLDLMTESLIAGENVKISGFGTFLLRDKAERVGRNPKTGIEVPITPRRVLIFRASQALRDKVSAA
jgi:integration host factor subunit alpha